MIGERKRDSQKLSAMCCFPRPNIIGWQTAHSGGDMMDDVRVSGARKLDARAIRPSHRNDHSTRQPTNNTHTHTHEHPKIHHPLTTTKNIQLFKIALNEIRINACHRASQCADRYARELRDAKTLARERRPVQPPPEKRRACRVANCRVNTLFHNPLHGAWCSM